ncbi:MAG: SgcJ/EcaC family oxidoreductase [Nitrososphaera sp.]|nr:SgcJ/EcaC family oxidoreductase [Nitrososphaera sp.]
MPGQNPEDTVNKLMEAINRGNLEAAMALYEPRATMVTEPGKLANGREAIRKAIEGFIALRPTLKGEAHQSVVVGDLALFCSKWRLKGTAPDGKPVEMSGTSSDVLRRQADGSWLIVIDNPWGPAIVG